VVWIKICGITNISDAENIFEMGPDVMGFVFYKYSPRNISLDDALTISKVLEQKVRESGKRNIGLSLSGIFVNEDPDRVTEAAEKLKLDYIQFSGDEEHDYLLKIKKKINEINKNKKEPEKSNLKTIKSVKVREVVNKLNSKVIFDAIDSLVPLVDYALLDCYSEKTYGGTGRTFNWDIVKDIGLSFPVILSGGLDAENVIPAMEVVKPFGVDASSRLEVSPGKKDIARVKDFIKTVRKWNKNEK
jgi:phosphoribosylanthranilate isomerase